MTKGRSRAIESMLSGSALARNSLSCANWKLIWDVWRNFNRHLSAWKRCTSLWISHRPWKYIKTLSHKPMKSPLNEPSDNYTTRSLWKVTFILSCSLRSSPIENIFNHRNSCGIYYWVGHSTWLGSFRVELRAKCHPSWKRSWVQVNRGLWIWTKTLCPCCSSETKSWATELKLKCIRNKNRRKALARRCSPQGAMMTWNISGKLLPVRLAVGLRAQWCLRSSSSNYPSLKMMKISISFDKGIHLRAQRINMERINGTYGRWFKNAEPNLSKKPQLISLLIAMLSINPKSFH